MEFNWNYATGGGTGGGPGIGVGGGGGGVGDGGTGHVDHTEAPHEEVRSGKSGKSSKIAKDLSARAQDPVVFPKGIKNTKGGNNNDYYSKAYKNDKSMKVSKGADTVKNTKNMKGLNTVGATNLASGAAYDDYDDYVNQNTVDDTFIAESSRLGGSSIQAGASSVQAGAYAELFTYEAGTTSRANDDYFTTGRMEPTPTSRSSSGQQQQQQQHNRKLIFFAKTNPQPNLLTWSQQFYFFIFI